MQLLPHFEVWSYRACQPLQMWKISHFCEIHSLSYEASKYFAMLSLCVFFGLSSRKYIFLCAIYIPPSESPYYSEDMFSTLEEETSHFQAQGNVLICGDLNARTGLQPDFTDTQGSKYINNKRTVINNTFSHIHRNNHDHTVNKNGKTSCSSVEAWVCISSTVGYEGTL